VLTTTYRQVYKLTNKALSTLSQKSATVAVFGDCRKKRRDNSDSRRIRRQSHFSATVWTGFKSLYEHPCDNDDVNDSACWAETLSGQRAFRRRKNRASSI